ncbi:phosphopyruvate hydratase [Candidatus Shapirobacteria bacterium CG06_land_8_20_14_3_00_40_12]|uniref:Enolase n=2 Tax=Candidatus Shapironibacteriota TaxID=1752721 RepID=A0A2M7TT08_9BACT|nr:MAG: phosphopyruvate hydratase [Candidatus Shapirobacteria bacterium CG06_land_8_20_14_3_00_40_12]PIZ58959.1 MAG: phosphopyruvate hydratase [Candidatus Shapirobacteria bacterium CG_4_10_14_0_2_um_filter_40_12]
MSKIKTIAAREILASGGAPSVEVTATLESGVIGEASVSYGVSSGSYEATVLLDGDEKRYNSRGMLGAVMNINSIIGPEIAGIEASGQRTIDEKMINLDGTEYKTKLGGNSILGVSMAVAKAEAEEEKLPLYKYLQKVYKLDPTNTLPKPMVVMIEGGKHADNSTDIQEYLVSSLGVKSAAEHIRTQLEIYEALKKILKNEGLSTNVGNEGAFAPGGILSNEKPIEYLVEAVKNAGYVPGIDAGISIDAAASEFAVADSQLSIINYQLRIENRTLSSMELIEYYLSWLAKYPIVSFEDMLDENDWENWTVLTSKMGNMPNIADDLTATNLKRWQKAIEMKAATAILVKLNQAGTVSETIDCCQLALENSMWTVVSHRGGGETNDTFMVDLAVAVGSEYIKCGPTRGERVAKYNRLMRIEEEINQLSVTS